MAKPWLTVDVAYGHPREWPQWPREEARGCLRRSWALSRAPGRERRSGASSRRSLAWAHALAELGGVWRTPQGVRERGEVGGQHGGVLRTSRHLDWREGEAQGG